MAESLAPLKKLSSKRIDKDDVASIHVFPTEAELTMEIKQNIADGIRNADVNRCSKLLDAFHESMVALDDLIKNKLNDDANSDHD